MKGVFLGILSSELRAVSAEHAEKPAVTIEDLKRKLSFPNGRTIPEDFFWDMYHTLDLRTFQNFSFEDLCKLRYSSNISMAISVDDLFKKESSHEVFEKVGNSMWRWGLKTGTWNEVVEAYEGIRTFTFFDHPDFSIRLDYTTGYNERGYSKHSRTFLDGVFGFLVYYKKKHVMTIGFSVMAGRCLLIQQVQSKARTGNRHLYKLPKNLFEFVLECFQRNFPNHSLYVVDGKCLIERILSEYERRLAQLDKTLPQDKKTAKRTGDSWDKERYHQRLKEATLLRERVAHIKSDASRIASFYNDLGRFTRRSEERRVNQLVHHEVTSVAA